jgi:hypothetical protein
MGGGLYADSADLNCRGANRRHSPSTPAHPITSFTPNHMRRTGQNNVARLWWDGVSNVLRLTAQKRLHLLSRAQ